MNDGGPAFPTLQFSTRTNQYGEGMSLRDYFAAKAMQGLCSLHDERGEGTAGGVHTIARHAYELADAMLAERAK